MSEASEGRAVWWTVIWREGWSDEPRFSRYPTLDEAEVAFDRLQALGFVAEVWGPTGRLCNPGGWVERLAPGGDGG